MRLLSILLSTIIYCTSAAAFEIPRNYTEKTALKMANNVPYKSIDLTIDKRLSRNKNADFQKFLNLMDKDNGFSEQYPFDIKLTLAGDQFYHVVCGDDPSADPHCSFIAQTCRVDDFYNEKGGCPSSAKIDIAGLKFYIPGDGCIYSEGHTDNYFNEHRVYCSGNNGITEKHQPLMYVGLKSKTTKAINLYADKEAKQIIATIPKNSFIEILLHENYEDLQKTSDLYYARDSFGVSGWAKLAGGNIGSPAEENKGDVVGLYYFGD